MQIKKINKLVLGTNNPGKVREIKKLIPKSVVIYTPKRLNIKSPKENGASFLENSLIKAKHFSKKTKEISLADDSGLEIDILGKDILDTYLAQGKGVIFITGHFGAWEIMGKWLGEYTDLFAGIALRQKNKGANQFFQEQRELPGTKQFYKREKSIEKAYEVLEQNGVLGLVSDQDARKKGVFVKFFGSFASTPKGAAIFHLNTDAPVMMGACIQKGFQKYQIKLTAVDTSIKDVEYITQDYTQQLEDYIRQNPEQYFWFHKRWKTKLDSHVSKNKK